MATHTHFVREGSISLNDLLSDNVISESDAYNIEHALALGPNRRSKPLHYVGLLETKKRQLFFLPKYCTENDEHHAKTVINVLRRVAKSQAIAQAIPDAHLFHSPSREGLLSKVELASFILEDFYDFGPLTLKSTQHVFSTDREPDWPKTFDRVEPIWTGKSWIHDHWVSRRKTSIDQHLIADIHLFVVAECHARYADLLGYPSITSAAPRTLSNTNRIDAILRATMRRQYAARNISVLKALRTWISGNNSPVKPVSYFGTCYFEYVWEDICSFLMHDKKNDEYWSTIMPFPQWRRLEQAAHFKAEGRFRLDCLTELPSQNGVLLTDAKYYRPQFRNETALGVPGMDSISKQVHYEEITLRSEKFLERYSQDGVVLNAFIFPERCDTRFIWTSGWVTVDNMTKKPVVSISLNPLQALDRYLKRKPLTEVELQIICDSTQLCRQ
jgi:LlaJI restriction endonuclease.